jgi:hypothetical protein
MLVRTGRNISVKATLFGAMVLAALVNLAQFRTINARANKNYRSFVRYANPDLVHIGTREAPLFRARHGRALAFANEINPGANLVLPVARESVDDEFAQQLLSYGGAAAIRRVEYDPSKLGKHIDKTKHVVANVLSSKRQRREFILISRGSDAREFAFMRHNKSDILIDVTLLSRRVRRALAS